MIPADQKINDTKLGAMTTIFSFRNPGFDRLKIKNGIDNKYEIRFHGKSQRIIKVSY